MFSTLPQFDFWYHQASDLTIGSMFNKKLWFMDFVRVKSFRMEKLLFQIL